MAIDDVSFDTKTCFPIDCNPSCLEGTVCDTTTKTCNCGKLRHVDEGCRSTLATTIFVDAAHYWSFEDHLSITDSKGHKHGIVHGTASRTNEGAHNTALKLNGEPSSWINFGDFSRECLGDFISCQNGLTLTVWIKHFLRVGKETLKKSFLSLGNVASGERGFEFSFDPSIQQGEVPLLSIRVNFPDKYCIYTIPVLVMVWGHFGFSFENANTLRVYHNGKLVGTSNSQACKSSSSKAPTSATLQAGLPKQKIGFQIDELVIWNKWLEENDYAYRYRYLVGGLEQKVSLMLKLNNEVWDDQFNDLESFSSKNLMNKILESFQTILSDSSNNGKSTRVIINEFSPGSVNVNVTLLFQSLTYNDTLLLENWLVKQQLLNTMPVSLLRISSSTVPDQFPSITTKGKNLTAIYVNWTYSGAYQLLQGFRILYKVTEQTDATFMVHDVIGVTNYTILSNMNSGFNYTMRLLLYTLAGDGLSSPVFFGTTLEDVPIEIPGNTFAMNTSSTSLNFTWAHIAKKNWRGVPLGYRIKYWSPEVPSDPELNITVSPDTNLSEIKLLRKYITYCLTVAAFNSAGDGNHSEPLCLMTDEEVPDAPLDSITIKNISSTEIQLTSTGVPFLNRNGIILNYVLYWSSQDSSGKVICVNGTLITCDLKGLQPYTYYNISVTSYTRIGAGPFSNYTILSDESVPSMPPRNVVGYNTSSTSITISWTAIPEDHYHGILGGYYISYAIKGFNKWDTAFVCPYQLSANLTGLTEYREYNISIAGFTSKGIGNLSVVFIWTDQDTPFSPPVDVTGTNLSSTRILLQWKNVPYEFARGIILGYKIMAFGYSLAYKNVRNETSWNVTIDRENKLQHVFTSLEMYADYQFQILAFTIKGEGNVSEVLPVRTDEDAPFKAPTNVTLKSDVWHSIQINWTQVPSDEIPGICRGYIIQYIRKEGSVDVLKNMTAPPTAITAVIPYLSGYIIYGVWISAFTYPANIGPSANISIKTEDWLPRIFPQDFSGFPISSTSLGLSWKKLPLELTNGIMVGYVVEYNNTNKSIAENATYPTEQTNAILTGLRKFDYYRIRIIAKNVNGFGNWSHYITIRTDEDVPEKPPANSSAASASPTSLIVNWNPVPFDYRHGFIVGYSIFYRPISMADEPVSYSTPKQIDVGPRVYQLTINGLTSYTEYSIVVLAQTIKGKGMEAAAITASTCRCFEHLLTNWRHMPPYVRMNITDKPMGMMPHVIESAVTACCRECPSFSGDKKIKVNFKIDGYGNHANKSKDIIVKTYIDDQTDISFPIFGFRDQTHFSKYYGYVPIVPSAGVAFIVSKDQSLASPQNVMRAIISCWPLIMFNFVLAFLVGLVVWLLDSKENPDHFHGSFIRGVASGFWFAFVTYTTVGYGDKTVVTIPARIFTVFWTLFGLVTFGIMMGSLSASLETMTFHETESKMMLYGTKVAVLDNSSEHRLGLRMNARVNSERRYETLEELQSAMLASEVKGALVDAYVASYRQELFLHPSLRVNKIYESNKAYGVVLAGPTIKIQRCVVKYMSENRAWIYEHIKSNSKSFNMSGESALTQVANELIDESSNVFMESRNSILILLLVAVAFGIAYEVYRMKFQSSEKYKVQIITDKDRADLNKLLLDLKENLANEKKKLENILNQKNKIKWKSAIQMFNK